VTGELTPYIIRFSREKSINVRALRASFHDFSDAS
jgi:hypothetical protein